MTRLLNAFSLNMVPASEYDVHVKSISLDEARTIVSRGFTSGIGHANTAAVISGMLGVPVEAKRLTFELVAGDTVLVAQYSGPRLPEGATSLPEGATIVFKLVAIH